MEPIKKILIDTNAYSSFMADNQLILDYIVDSEIIYLSSIVIGELFAGFFGGKKVTENRHDLKNFIGKSGVQIFDVTIETAEIFGEVKNELRKKGKMIPINDIWVAAQTIETGSKLITFDSHFDNISGLRIWEEIVKKYNKCLKRIRFLSHFLHNFRARNAPTWLRQDKRTA